jgi:hypothetical protein
LLHVNVNFTLKLCGLICFFLNTNLKKKLNLGLSSTLKCDFLSSRSRVYKDASVLDSGAVWTGIQLPKFKSLVPTSSGSKKSH